MKPRLSLVFLLSGLMTAATLDAQAPRQTQRTVVVPKLPVVVLDAQIEVKTVTGVPYSADVLTETVQTLSDGNRIVSRTTGKVARDGAGRVRREETRSDGSVEVSIHDPVAQTVTTLDLARKTARVNPGLARYTMRQTFDGRRGLSTLVPNRFFAPPTSRPVTRADASPGETTAEEALAEKMIEGVRATGTRRTTTIPAGAIGNEQPIRVVTEEWTSPDLQVLVLTDFNDPRTIRTTYKLTNITRDHPDAALFTVPAGFRIARGATLPIIKR